MTRKVSRPVALGSTLALTLGATLGIFATPLVAHAETTPVAETIFDVTSTNLGVEITDPELAESITEDIDFALENEIIDPDLVGVIDETDGTVDDTKDVDGILDDNLGEQDGAWEETADLYRDAFNAVRAQFEACRAEPGPANVCARDLGLRMQVAVATDALARLDALGTDEDGNPLTEEQIAELRAELLAKIDRAQARLEARSGTDPEAAAAVADIKEKKVKAGLSVEDIAETPNQTEVEDGSQPGKSENANGGSGNSGNGNSGNSGNGNGNGSGNSGNSNGNGNGNGNSGNGKGNSGNGNGNGRGSGSEG